MAGIIAATRYRSHNQCQPGRDWDPSRRQPVRAPRRRRREWRRGRKPERNEFLGLAYRFPQSWTSATPEDLDQSNAENLRWMREHAAAEAKDVPVPKTIFQAQPDSRSRLPFVRITVQKCDAVTADTVQQNAAELKRFYGLAVIDPPHQITIGKGTLFRTDFQLPLANPPAWATSLETMAVGYRVALEIYARSKEELDSLAGTAQSLSILKL